MNNIQAVLTKLQRHEFAAAAIVAGIVVLFVIFMIIKRHRPKKLNPNHFRERWHELQKQCGAKSTWPLAIIDADKLLDEALRLRRFKGKTMGERLVAAQRELTDNESVWLGHKLRNKLVHEEYKLRSKREVKDALLGYWQALRDLGALNNDK